MTRNQPPDNLLIVEFDARRDRALLRGARAVDVIAYVSDKPGRWSAVGRGFVVPTPVAVDAVAWAEYAHFIVKVTEKKD